MVLCKKPLPLKLQILSVEEVLSALTNFLTLEKQTLEAEFIWAYMFILKKKKPILNRCKFQLFGVQEYELYSWLQMC